MSQRPDKIRLGRESATGSAHTEKGTEWTMLWRFPMCFQIL